MRECERKRGMEKEIGSVYEVVNILGVSRAKIPFFSMKERRDPPSLSVAKYLHTEDGENRKFMDRL